MKTTMIAIGLLLVVMGCSGCPLWNHPPSHASIVIYNEGAEIAMSSIGCRYRVDDGELKPFMEEHRDRQNSLHCIERGISDNSQRSFQPVLLFTTSDSIFTVELIGSPLEDVFLNYRGEIRRDRYSEMGELEHMVPLGHITGNDLDSLGYYVTYTQ